MSEEIFEFENFALDRGAYELRRDGAVVPLQRIPLELLFLLVERRGHLVTREEILERVWGKGVFVDSEASINTAVRKLRRALHDDREAPRFVVTVPARGYRFVAEIRGPKAVRAEQIRARPPSAMVGREAELASLLGGLDNAVSRRGRLFLVSGEPGIGKTRLADEVALVAGARRMTILAGHCSEQDEAVAYLPFVEILENFVDRTPNLDRLRIALGDQGPELARLLPKLKSILPELAPPIDLPPAQARRHLFNCFCEFAARVSREQPALMILDDLHWADDSTLSLLDHLAQRLSDLPLLVVGTFRDSDANLNHGLAKMLENLLRARLAARVTLKRLPRDEVAAMLKSLSGKSPPAAVVSGMYAETSGNPFFIEELFRHLEEENRLYDSAGEFRPELKIGEIEAPASVRLVVARRLARLSDLTQKMLGTAATIGRFFSFDLLQAASAAGADSLLESIEEAEKAGLVFSITDGPKARFQFSHELIRQSVIGGMSAARRQRLHLELAEAIERTYRAGIESMDTERRGEHLAELAYHYARGGDPGKALKYCLNAARRFSYLGSNAEAMAQSEAGLAILQDLPDDDYRADLELDFRNAVFGPLGDSKGFASPEAEQSYTRAIELCQRPGINWEKAWWALVGVFFVQQLRPDVRKAEAIAAELAALAQQHGNLECLAEAETWLAYSRMVSGNFELAALDYDRAWARLESIAIPSTGLILRLAGQTPQTRMIWEFGTQQNNRILSGWNAWFMGYPDRALERMNIATAIAHSGPKTILADIHGFAAYIAELRREPELMRARAHARLALSTESGYVTGRALSEIYLGWADTIAGDLDGGVARMQRHMQELKTVGSEYISDRCCSFIAVGLGQMKRFDEALRVIGESFQFIERTGQRYYEAELHRLKGELLLAQDGSHAAQAEKSFLAAIGISRKQRAKSWELRATISLARMLAKRHARDKARVMLAEIYNWFTEGFDIADLKDAKALLEELGV